MSNYTDIREIEFQPLSEAKAHLSHVVRTLSPERRVAITTNGRPTAVLLSYNDYLSLLPQQSHSYTPRRISMEEWKREEPQRLAVRDSILGLFDMKSLGRKGQKRYKQEAVRGFKRKVS